MEEKMNLHQKLLKVQQELKAPKSQYNSFGKYHYRSCEDILEAVKPILAKYNLLLTVYDELVCVGARYYIKATAKVIDIKKPTLEDAEVSVDNAIWNTAYAREEEEKKGMDGSQITGTASSYARKYALNGLFLIDDTKDADTDEYTNVNENKITEKQIAVISGAYQGENMKKLLTKYKIENLKDMDSTIASGIISKLYEAKKND